MPFVLATGTGEPTEEYRTVAQTGLGRNSAFTQVYLEKNSRSIRILESRLIALQVLGFLYDRQDNRL